MWHIGNIVAEIHPKTNINFRNARKENTFFPVYTNHYQKRESVLSTPRTLHYSKRT